MSREYYFLALGGLAALAAYFGNSASLGVQAVSGDSSFTQWDSLFQSYGSQYGVPWRWLKAICMNESSLGENASVADGIANPSDVSGSASSDGKSWGLMQLTLATASALDGSITSPEQLNDPATSVRLAAMLLAQLIRTFGISDRSSVIQAYNGGPHFHVLLTAPYYARFVANLAVVMSQQPGNELET